MKSVKVALNTLGCKVNQAETEEIARQLTLAGCQIVSPEERADIYILNTCTVTHVADRKSRHWLRQIRLRNPYSVVVATGCYADRARDELTKIGVDLIVTNSEKSRMVQLLKTAGYIPDTEGKILTRRQQVNIQTNNDPSHCNLTYNNRNKAYQRTRAFIKIQDGCNKFCSYCIIPLVRKEVSSIPSSQIVQKIKQLELEGYKEIILTGVEVGSYRYKDERLVDLLTKVIEVTNIPRLRISSLQPQEINESLLSIWENPRMCPHFHISLQSGSDSILKRMNRGYDTYTYANTVERIRRLLPEAAITTDIIVGFPGEEEKEFQETLNFCRLMNFARIHVFPYSPRQGTAAAVFPDQIPDHIKKKRVEIMLGLAQNSILSFNTKFTGRTLEVLFENKEDKFWSGLTRNYIRVFVESPQELGDKIVPVYLEKVHDDGLSGRINLEDK